MKFSYRWLAEFVPGLDVQPGDLERLITMKTAECEGIERFGAHFAGVQAVKVIGVEPIPGSKNHRVDIQTSAGPKTVVCGAPNVRPGMTAAWVMPGTELEGKQIRAAVISGVESQGMLASAAELGVGRDTTGLLELDGGFDVAPDWIIEIDNKSLTHRPDLWGHFGMAREVAAIADRQLVYPAVPELPSVNPAFRAEIEDYALCSRYSALLVEDIRVAPSPLWMQARLESIGLNAINNIVDITNYVLAELPQPMHAFDADKLRGNVIYVRRAREGETLLALNGETYTLTSADVVIADAGGPIALAGVIGGMDTAISSRTCRIVFESANFDAATVRLTSVRHKLRTDASMRFEKSLDAENTVRGIARAVSLLQSGRPTGGVTDARGPVPKPTTIEITADFVARKLGTHKTPQELTKIFSSLGFNVRSNGDVLSVTVPTWRATKDVSVPADLVEEAGRMIGYDTITPRPPLIAAAVPPANPLRTYLRGLRTEFADQGFTEVYNYSFVNEAEIGLLGLDPAAHIAVRNPIASEQTHLRTSLLPGLLRNLRSNARHFQEFRIFEIGSLIDPVPGSELPSERAHAAAMLYNARGAEEDFFEMKRVMECILPGARLSAAQAHSFEHPARCGSIRWHGVQAGRLAELHPGLLMDDGIPGRAMLLCLDAEECHSIAAAQVLRYHPSRKYPTSGFDLSVVADLRRPVAEIEDTLRTLGGEAIAGIEFVRQYAGSPLPEGKKSVSYHLEVGAADRTLTAEEAGQIRARLIEGMRTHGYDLRV